MGFFKINYFPNSRFGNEEGLDRYLETLEEDEVEEEEDDDYHDEEERVLDLHEIGLENLDIRLMETNSYPGYFCFRKKFINIPPTYLYREDKILIE